MGITALLDRSVEDNLQLAEGVAIPCEINWGGTRHTFTVAGIKLRSKFRKSDIWYWRQVCALPTIASLARSNKLRLHTYTELNHESWQASANIFISSLGDLRRDIKLIHLDPAVERGFFQQMEESEYIQDKRLIDFYKFLKQLDYQQLISRAPKFVAKLPALTRKNLDQLGRFRKLCNAVGEKHFRDAFHLWTAEAHGLDYFLTMDKAFLNALTQSSRLELPTMPIFPRELVTRMGVSELEPLPIEEGYVYDISGHRQKM